MDTVDDLTGQGGSQSSQSTPQKAASTQSDPIPTSPARHTQQQIDNFVSIGGAVKNIISILGDNHELTVTDLDVRILLAKRERDDAQKQCEIIAKETHDFQVKRNFFVLQKKFKKDSETVERLEKEKQMKKMHAAEKLYSALPLLIFASDELEKAQEEAKADAQAALVTAALVDQA
eukprot:jgi/Mesvir1/20074/Mv13323-RA.1